MLHRCLLSLLVFILTELDAHWHTTMAVVSVLGVEAVPGVVSQKMCNNMAEEEKEHHQKLPVAMFDVIFGSDGVVRCLKIYFHIPLSAAVLRVEHLRLCVTVNIYYNGTYRSAASPPYSSCYHDLRFRSS